eukprot:659775-Amphidinium_carterae.1
MAGRSLSHLLYKISRCNTGADEMNRDFGHGGAFGEVRVVETAKSATLPCCEASSSGHRKTRSSEKQWSKLLHVAALSKPATLAALCKDTGALLSAILLLAH